MILKKLLIEEVKKRIFEIHGDTIILDETTYKNTHKKCRFIDKDFGEWWAIPDNIFHGHTNSKRGPVKTKRAIFEKYGVEVPIQNKGIKEKIKQTNIERYGVENPFESEKVKEKIKQTNIRKLGVEYPIQNKSVKEKTKQTNIERYGVSNPSQNDIIKQKTKQTNLKKYGVEYPFQSKDIQSKIAFSQQNKIIKYHWRDGRQLICQASWEPKVVDWLNKNQIDFLWQLIDFEPFEMPNGKMYRPDLFLIEQNKWIEIKGWFRRDAKEKWDWFHSQYPNSELWNEPKLKEMKIL